jgi:hypothetical protein
MMVGLGEKVELEVFGALSLAQSVPSAPDGAGSLDFTSFQRFDPRKRQSAKPSKTTPKCQQMAQLRWHLALWGIRGPLKPC